jgi:hypothetical protein
MLHPADFSASVFFATEAVDLCFPDKFSLQLNFGNRVQPKLDTVFLFILNISTGEQYE